MPIREESFRIGCGRYIQGVGYISKIAEEVLRLGKKPIIIGDDITLSLTREKIEKSLVASCNNYEIIYHNGTCNDERAAEISEHMKSNGFDVVVGVGGGVIMDFAKLCASFAGARVINIPTSSATCASYAPLSVRYTPDGKTVGTKHYITEVDAVIADTEILSAQPIRLLLSGVFDAMAKFVEIKQRYNPDSDFEYPIGLDYAYAMSVHSFNLLSGKIEECISDMTGGRITHTVDNVIFTAIAATGVISGIARGSNQCAIAHKFYENTRKYFYEASKPYLHGEIVGIGLLIQNHFNGEVENNDFLLGIMKKHGMPHSLADLGIEATEENKQIFFDSISNSSAVDKNNAAECEKLKSALDYFFNM